MPHCYPETHSSLPKKPRVKTHLSARLPDHVRGRHESCAVWGKRLCPRARWERCTERTARMKFRRMATTHRWGSTSNHWISTHSSFQSIMFKQSSLPDRKQQPILDHVLYPGCSIAPACDSVKRRPAELEAVADTVRVGGFASPRLLSLRASPVTTATPETRCRLAEGGLKHFCRPLMPVGGWRWWGVGGNAGGQGRAGKVLGGVEQPRGETAAHLSQVEGPLSLPSPCRPPAGPCELFLVLLYDRWLRRSEAPSLVIRVLPQR